MATIDIIFIVVSLVGMTLSLLLAWFVTFQLPEVLIHDREQYPPGTNFAAVYASSNGPVDLVTRPWPALDGVELRGGERVLLRHQRDKRENGIWLIPMHFTSDWQRAPDLHTTKQLVEGATVFVHQGQRFKGATFVLRVLLNGKRLPPPGKCDIDFIPLFEHLFGVVPPNRILRMNEHGVPDWSDYNAALATEHNIAPSSSIPKKLHIMQHIGDTDTVWQNECPDYQVTVWDERKGLELMQELGQEWLSLYHNTKEHMRGNVVRAVVLYTQGGWSISNHTHIHKLLPAVSCRLQLITEGYFTTHEADLLNAMPIRMDHTVPAGTHRVDDQVIGAAPRHALIRFWLQHMMYHIPRLVDYQNKYDVSFTMGADSLSYVFYRYGSDFVDIDIDVAPVVTEKGKAIVAR